MSAALRVDGQPLGMVGELSAEIAADNDLPRRTCVFDLDGDLLERLVREARTHFTKIPEFPAITRDIAPVFGPEVAWASIESAARAAAGDLLESLRLTDVYGGLSDSRCALTLRLVFRADRTLTGDEVDTALNEVRAALTALGGEFRA